jgi:hypothetical protein
MIFTSHTTEIEYRPGYPAVLRRVSGSIVGEPYGGGGSITVSTSFLIPSFIILQDHPFIMVI